MIFLLPSRSSRKYRGKYPERINSWGYSKSRSQQAIADYLGISRPVHIELNDGRRYIADMKSLRREGIKLGAELVEILSYEISFQLAEYGKPAWEDLSQARYDELITLVRSTREGAMS